MEWYALRVKPQHEKTVSISLQGKGYTEFLPVYPSQRRSARNFHKPVHLPLFPGYVFARFDVERRLPILTIPGVLFVLSINRIPIPVLPRRLPRSRPSCDPVWRPSLGRICAPASK